MRIILTLILLGGCSPDTQIKSQQPRRNASYNTWEYRCIETNRETVMERQVGFTEFLEEDFNALGEKGWEMVGYGMNNGVNVRYVCFKRPR